jgi:hypothetical protein
MPQDESQKTVKSEVSYVKKKEGCAGDISTA